MNNTQTLAIVAVLTAATLVVGGTLAAASAQSVVLLPNIGAQNDANGGGGHPANLKKGSHDNGSDKIKGNGNTDTDTIQKCKQFASGFDPTFGDQNCDILSNSNISQAAVTPTPPTPKTCVECFTSLLTPQQITVVVSSEGTLAELCASLEQGVINEDQLIRQLNVAGVSETIQAQLIECLINAGIPFEPLRVG